MRRVRTGKTACPAERVTPGLKERLVRKGRRDRRAMLDRLDLRARKVTPGRKVHRVTQARKDRRVMLAHEAEVSSGWTRRVRSCR